MRTCSYCGGTFTPRDARQRFCRTVCRERQLGRGRRVRRGTTVSRGYDAAHKRERKRWEPIVAAGHAACCRCGRPIVPGSTWHLDHDDADRSRYRGVAHGSCNVRAGAQKGNRERVQPGVVSYRPRIV